MSIEQRALHSSFILRFTISKQITKAGVTITKKITKITNLPRILSYLIAALFSEIWGHISQVSCPLTSTIMAVIKSKDILILLTPIGISLSDSFVFCRYS